MPAWLEKFLIKLFLAFAELLGSKVLSEWAKQSANKEKKEGEEKNENVREKVDTAITDEDIQSALDGAAARFGRRNP